MWIAQCYVNKFNSGFDSVEELGADRLPDFAGPVEKLVDQDRRIAALSHQPAMPQPRADGPIGAHQRRRQHNHLGGAEAAAEHNQSGDIEQDAPRDRRQEPEHRFEERLATNPPGPCLLILCQLTLDARLVE